MEDIDDLETLRSILKPMTERGLIVWLSEGRGAMLTHGFHEAGELQGIKVTAPTAESEVTRPRPAAATEDHSAIEARLNQVQAEVSLLRDRLTALESKLHLLEASIRVVPPSTAAVG
jgi:hypothetical protein